jgi:hypothetical protein
MNKGVFTDLRLVTPIGDDGGEASGSRGGSYSSPSLAPLVIEARTSSSFPPPLPTAAARQRRDRLARWWGPMFFMFCVGAFLMMVGVVLGAKVVGPNMVGEKMVSAAHAQPALRETVISARSVPFDLETPGAVTELELQQITGDGELAVSDPERPEPTVDPGRRHRREALSGSRPHGRPKADVVDGGKSLSEQSRAMLERMGEGMDLVPSQALSRKAGAEPGRRPEGIREEQLYRTISRGKRQLQRCYETALRYTVSEETIRLDVDLTVGVSGRVDRIKTRGRTLGNMDECIERVIRGWRFPTAGRATDTSFPLIFQPGE